jgi:hypothetical protein
MGKALVAIRAATMPRVFLGVAHGNFVAIGTQRLVTHLEQKLVRCVALSTRHSTVKRFFSVRFLMAAGAVLHS